MLPEIRAWDKKHGEMIRIVSINYDEEFVRGLSLVEDNIDIESSYNFSELEFMQSSNVEDIHGNQYYCKDIAVDIDSEEFGLVDYEDGVFVMKFANGSYSVELNEVKDNFEIVGNFFENRVKVAHDE